MPKRLLKQNSFSFKTKINNNENTNSSDTIGRESLIKNNFTNDENERLNEQLILEEIDVDVNELIDADQPSASIVYFPSSYAKPLVETNR